MNEIELIVPVLCSTRLTDEDEIRANQSLVTQKLINLGCLDIAKAPIYSIKLKVELNNE